MTKILIVEDDSNLLETLRYNLQKESYEVLTVSDGLKALETARAEIPDLIILDLMLPGMNGLEVCRILRLEMTVPVLMLTAKVEEIDKIIGLEIGADDYMTKPFSMRELLARVHALLRRGSMKEKPASPDETIIHLGDIRIDPSRHRVDRGGEVLDLTPKEFDLLIFLAKNRNLVFNREQLLQKVWGYEYAGDTRTVDVHIRWLRQKIEAEPHNPRILITVRGTGYKLEG